MNSKRLSGGNKHFQIKGDAVPRALMSSVLEATSRTRRQEPLGPPPQKTYSKVLSESRPSHRRTKGVVNSPSFYVPQLLSFFLLCSRGFFRYRAQPPCNPKCNRPGEPWPAQKNPKTEKFMCEHCDAAPSGPSASRPVHQSRCSIPPPPHLFASSPP